MSALDVKESTQQYMVELLVASLCFGGYKCDEAAKAYFEYNPYPQVWAYREANKVHNSVSEIVGEQTLIGLSTIAAAATQKTYQIKINKYFSFGQTINGLELRYGLTF